jgi:hypothetical protein
MRPISPIRPSSAHRNLETMRVIIAILAALVVIACSEDAAVQSNSAREWTKCETVVQLTDKSINESSGIAASSQDDTFFTHNDSGDTARFFKFNRKGDILAIYDVANAKAVDWEDMASAQIGGKRYLYFGDIGDNAGKRENITVYRVPEPGKETSVQADRIYTLKYPDEPHNAETLMVQPITGDLYIVTKAATRPSMVFKLPKPDATGTFTLKKVGELQVGSTIREGKLVTGGDISPDAKHVVLRSYLEAWEFDVPANFDDWLKAKPRRIQTNFEFQGEAICYSKDGSTILTTSEGTPCQVSEAKRK